MSIPLTSRVVLGTTSLWMVIPIIYGKQDQLLLRSLLALVCTMSMSYWYNPTSLTLQLDRICVCVFSAVLMINSRYVTVFIIPIIFVYVLANYFHRHNMHGAHLVSHLVFRYIFYWWCHFVIVGNFRMFITQSHVYVVNAIVLSILF